MDSNSCDGERDRSREIGMHVRFVSHLRDPKGLGCQWKDISVKKVILIQVNSGYYLVVPTRRKRVPTWKILLCIDIGN